MDQLEKVRFQSNKKSDDSAQPPFRVSLINGDRIFGDLLSIDASSVVLKTSHFSEPLTIEKSQLQKIEHLNGFHIRYSGPSDLSKWSSIGRNRKPNEWEANVYSEFLTYQWIADLFRPIKFSEQVEVAFRVITPHDRPDFEVGLLRKPEDGPRIETWGDSLVLTHGTRYEMIKKLSDTDRDLSLRLFWNQKSGQVKVANYAGEVLASLQTSETPKDEDPKSTSRTPSTRSTERGFTLLNRTTEMRLAHVSVREWDGEKIPVIDVTRPRVEMIDGETVFSIDGLRKAPGQESFSIGGRKISPGSIAEMVFTPKSDLPKPAELVKAKSQSHVAWHDGSTVSGALEEISDGSVRIKPIWSGQSLDAVLEDASQLIFPTSEKEIQYADQKISTSGISLLGKVETAPGDGTKENQGSLAWRPVGSLNASVLNDGARASITHSSHASNLGASDIGEARLFLTNGEILSGTLLSVQTQSVNFTSANTGEISIPTSKVNAVDMTAAGKVLKDFADKDWEAHSATEDGKGITMAKDRVVLRKGTFGHPSILAGDLIRFRGTWKNSHGSITLRLFAADRDRGSPSVDVVFAAQGKQMFVGQANRGGAFNFSGERVPITDNAADIEVQARPDKVVVSLNGKKALTIKVKPDQISGNGIYIHEGGGWQGWGNIDNEVTFSGFSVTRSSGHVPQKVIDPKARTNALTIPRMQKDSPPTHLLIAPNGDLLRGKLLVATGDAIKFTSKGTTMDIPKRRVASIVWLREKDAEPDSKEAKKPIDPFADKNFKKLQDLSFSVSHAFTLHNGSYLKLARQRVTGDNFFGTSSVLGQVKVNASEIWDADLGPPTPAYRTKTAKKEIAHNDWFIEFTPDPVIPNSGDDGGTDSPLVGKKAPDFELATLDDKKVKLSSLKGKVVVLDFWATWCGPCIRAMPDVLSVVSAFQKQRTNVVFYAVNQAEPPILINGFLEKRNWEMPVALDYDLKASNAFGANSIPYTVVVGKDGNVAWVHVGYTDKLKDDLAEAIAKALAK